MTVDEVKAQIALLTVIIRKVDVATKHLEQNSPVRAYKVLETLDRGLQKSLSELSGWYPSE